MKKKIKLSSYIRKFRMEQLQSHVWLTASSWGNICAFPLILGSSSSYMTLQLLHSEFPFIWGKSYFLFYQCIDFSKIQAQLGERLGMRKACETKFWLFRLGQILQKCLCWQLQTPTLSPNILLAGVMKGCLFFLKWLASRALNLWRRFKFTPAI